MPRCEGNHLYCTLLFKFLYTRVSWSNERLISSPKIKESIIRQDIR